MRAPSQIYKWVSHNEYDDTKQKYSSVSSGNSHNLIYSILLWQIHYRNALCSKGLLNHLWKNSEIGVGKSASERSTAEKQISKATLLWYAASFRFGGRCIILGFVIGETGLVRVPGCHLVMLCDWAWPVTSLKGEGPGPLWETISRILFSDARWRWCGRNSDYITMLKFHAKSLAVKVLISKNILTVSKVETVIMQDPCQCFIIICITLDYCY